MNLHAIGLDSNNVMILAEMINIVQVDTLIILKEHVICTESDVLIHGVYREQATYGHVPE